MSLRTDKQLYDVAVIGGGASGMMAAIFAARTGARVILIEKNKTLGRKVLLTGGGRCNLTQADIDIRSLVNFYKPNGKFLYKAFNHLSPASTMELFTDWGVPLKVEADGRVFPLSNRASDIVMALEGELRRQKVKVSRALAVVDLVVKNKNIVALKTSTGEVVARNYILTTGGITYPQTGSSGEMFECLRHAQQKITKLSPALVPISVKNFTWGHLAGLTLDRVTVSFIREEKAIARVSGPLVITHSGFSGPVILNASRDLARLSSLSRATLSIDFLPEHSRDEIIVSLTDQTKQTPSRKIKTLDLVGLPARLKEEIFILAQLDLEKRLAELSKADCLKLTQVLKKTVYCGLSFDKLDEAMITVGGVDLSLVDPSTLRSKKINNLYFAGEILDIDGATGGYNLQQAWSTGALAGTSAAQNNLSN